MRECFGAIPENYLVLDTETLCFGKGNLPVEIGHTLVEARKPITQRAYLIDWTRCPYVQEDWLRDQLAAVKDRMERDYMTGENTGRVYDVTYEKLRDEGKPYITVLQYYLDLVRRVTKRGFCAVGHNVKFDTELLSNTWSEFLGGKTFEFSDTCVWDTGSLYKASLMGLLPLPREPLEDFMHRARYAKAPGVKWNILHCIQSLGLIDQHGLNPSRLHGAGYDSYCTHLILESLRTMLETAK